MQRRRRVVGGEDDPEVAIELPFAERGVDVLRDPQQSRLGIVRVAAAVGERARELTAARQVSRLAPRPSVLRAVAEVRTGAQEGHDFAVGEQLGDNGQVALVCLRHSSSTATNRAEPRPYPCGRARRKARQDPGCPARARSSAPINPSAPSSTCTDSARWGRERGPAGLVASDITEHVTVPECAPNRLRSTGDRTTKAPTCCAFARCAEEVLEPPPGYPGPGPQPGDAKRRSVQVVRRRPDRLVAWTIWTHQTIWMLPRGRRARELLTRAVGLEAPRYTAVHGEEQPAEEQGAHEEGHDQHAELPVARLAGYTALRATAPTCVWLYNVLSRSLSCASCACDAETHAPPPHRSCIRFELTSRAPMHGDEQRAH